MGVGIVELLLILAVAVTVFGGAALAFVMAVTSRHDRREGRSGHPMWPLALVGAGLLAMVLAAGAAVWYWVLG